MKQRINNETEKEKNVALLMRNVNITEKLFKGYAYPITVQKMNFSIKDKIGSVGTQTFTELCQSSLHWKSLALYDVLLKNLPLYNTTINFLRES